MSIFSKIVLSRKAAKEHKQKKKGEEPDVVVQVPYKHVPTHAAVDALSGAPSTWQREDLSKIKEHHKRRSQMAISRTGSSLSTMSYMNAAAGPSSQASAIPRVDSYSSYNPAWFDRGGDLAHSYEKESSPRRQKHSRGHSYHDSGIGPSAGPSTLASKVQSEDVSPVISCGNSTNSTSSVEMTMASNRNRMSFRPQPNVYAEKDIFDRLHTSTTRKLGEAPLYDSPPVKAPVVTTTAVAQEQKQHRSRWSLMGKKRTSTISAM